jgi:ATP-dependent DNA ligase
VAHEVLDGEVCGETGSDGIQAVLEVRGHPGTPTCFLAFDVLTVGGREVMAEPWTDPRKRLEDLSAGLDSTRIAVAPVPEDAAHFWVGRGGEGIVVKDRRAPYTPGQRSRAWLKIKHRLTLRARVLDGEPELVKWGDGGRAARLGLRYRHPRSGATTTIGELVRVPAPDTFELHKGAWISLPCWGILPSGRLRHPILLL